MKHRLFSLMITVALFVFAAPRSLEAQLFQSDIDSNAGDISVSGNKFSDLVYDTVEGTNSFTGFTSSNIYTARIKYAGIPNAIQITGDTTGTIKNINVQIPSTGFDREFNGLTTQEVQQQIETFFENEGSKELFKFIATTNSNSPLALLDGNPRATTALMSGSAYQRFGFRRTLRRVGLAKPSFESEQTWRPETPEEWLERRGPENDAWDIGVSSNAFYSFVESDAAPDLNAAGGDIMFEVRPFGFGGFTVALVGQDRQYSGTEMHDGGAEIGIPVTLLWPGDEVQVFWEITTHVQLAGGIAEAAAAAGTFTGGGMTSALEITYDAFQFLLVNHWSYYEGIDLIEVNGVDVETDLQQLVLRNGFKATWHITDWAFVDAGVTITNFALGNAYTHTYFTPTVTGNIHYQDWVNFRFGYEGEIANGINSHNLIAQFEFLY